MTRASVLLSRPTTVVPRVFGGCLIVLVVHALGPQAYGARVTGFLAAALRDEPPTATGRVR